MTEKKTSEKTVGKLRMGGGWNAITVTAEFHPNGDGAWATAAAS
jgi:hypothetical protein